MTHFHAIRHRRSVEPFRTYFLTCSCKDRMQIFKNDCACIAYLLVLRRIVVTMNVALHGYALMPDHVHLLVMPRGCTLSQFLFRLQGASARYINRLMNRRGQLWDHFCYDRLLTTEKERSLALQYIHENPIKDGLPENYLWSSFRANRDGYEDIDPLLSPLQEY